MRLVFSQCIFHHIYCSPRLTNLLYKSILILFSVVMFIVYYYPTFCTVTYKRKINHVTFLYVTSEIGEVEQKMYEELFHLKEMLLAFNLLVCVLNFCRGIFCIGYNWIDKIEWFLTADTILVEIIHLCNCK